MSRPIAEGLFTESALIGARCGSCGATAFPAQDGCPRCGTEGMQRVELPRRGTVWTWTTQGFLPKAPYTGHAGSDDEFAGYLVAYVELPGAVMVETHLVDVAADDVQIGMEVEYVVVPFREDADGTEVMAYAFRPLGGPA